MGKKLSKICLTEEELAHEIASVVEKGRDQSMMEKMIFGRYIPGDSFVHRMDPRSKLLFVFAFIVIVFFANNTITYGLLLVFTLFVILFSRIRLYFLFMG